MALAFFDALVVNGPLQAASARCPEERNAYSRPSPPVIGTFVNRRADVVRIYWIDQRGVRKFYFEMAPGASQTVNTYQKHPWIATNGSEDCIRIGYFTRYTLEFMID
jgi:hypothetical protein